MYAEAVAKDEIGEPSTKFPLFFRSEGAWFVERKHPTRNYDEGYVLNTATYPLDLRRRRTLFHADGLRFQALNRSIPVHIRAQPKQDYQDEHSDRRVQEELERAIVHKYSDNRQEGPLATIPSRYSAEDQAHGQAGGKRQAHGGTGESKI